MKVKVIYRWNAGWTVAGRRATVPAKMKEQPPRIKKNKVKIKASTALFLSFVTKFCDIPNMSWTMLVSVVVIQHPMNIPSPSVNYFHLLVAFCYHG